MRIREFPKDREIACSRIQPLSRTPRYVRGMAGYLLERCILRGGVGNASPEDPDDW